MKVISEVAESSSLQLEVGLLSTPGKVAIAEVLTKNMNILRNLEREVEL